VLSLSQVVMTLNYTTIMIWFLYQAMLFDVRTYTVQYKHCRSRLGRGFSLCQCNLIVYFLTTIFSFMVHVTCYSLICNSCVYVPARKLKHTSNDDMYISYKPNYFSILTVALFITWNAFISCSSYQFVFVKGDSHHFLLCHT